MATFEQGYALGKFDQKEIDAYNHTHSYNQGSKDKEESILRLLEDPIHHNIRFPDEHVNCYGCVLVDIVKKETHPPERFRDKANGE